MKKKVLNTGIIIFFLLIFYNCVKATGIYTVIAEDEKINFSEVVIKAADTISVEYAGSIREKENQPIVAEGMTKGEPMVRAVHEEIPYYVPLDEIAERIEYIYVYANIWVDSTEKKYGELEYLKRFGKQTV